MTRLPKKRGITQAEEDKSLILRQIIARILGVTKTTAGNRTFSLGCRDENI